jgi:hypothetical protein
MITKGFSVASGGGQFNTLAQTGTAFTGKRSRKRPVTVKGQGTEQRNSPALINRARRKMITQKLTLALIDLATKRQEPEKVKAYWNTYHCQSNVVSAGGRLFGNYCKNRFCTLCAGIRKAEIINKYLPVLETWQAPYFVTLTAKAVPVIQLKSRFDRMLRSFQKLIARNKKRYQRGKGIKLEGIRSIECNFNPERRTYNPHFHLILNSRAAAELIISEWLKQCTPKFAVRAAQNMRRVEDRQHDIIEIVKYGSKIFTDPTLKKNAKRKVSPFIYVSAFHNIIWAMAGHRVFDRFGFNLPPRCKVSNRKIVTDYELLTFDAQLFDWISPDTGALLTEYKPSHKLLNILNTNLDLNSA